MRIAHTTQLLIALIAFSTPLSLKAIAQELPPLPIQFDPTRTNAARVGNYEGTCEADGKRLSAIAYTNPTTQVANSALTAQAQPTLWFYSPFPIEAASATFTLSDAQGNSRYESMISEQTESAGIFSIKIPEAITLGVPLQWSLALNCEGEQTTLSGWIERGELYPDLARMVEAVGERNQAALYASYGVLQDAITAIATLRLTDPENEILAQDWSTFLSALNLSELANEPILDCCQVGAIEEIEEIEEETEQVVEESEEVPEMEEPEEDNRTILQRARDRGR